MKKKSLAKRMTSSLLCMALVLSGLAVPAKEVQAEETTSTEKTIAGLGTSMIVDPVAPASDNDAWKGSYVTKNGNTITIPYNISGNNNGNATQVSVLILDKEYTAGNSNGAKVLAYEKIADVNENSTSGTGTFTLQDSLSGKKVGTDYHIYIIAEDVNGEKETDYASTPVEVYFWKAPTVKTMNFGTQGIIDPAIPNSADDEWKGCYVYYGNYDGSPVKYRVLDASTTKFGGTTMLLDCDSILYYQKFDEDGTANADGKKEKDWSISDVKNSLNGKGEFKDIGFIDTAFTATERSAIAASTVDSHALTTDSETGVGVADWTRNNFVNYVALTGEQIFLLDAEDVSNGAYGYSMTDKDCGNRKKTGSSAAYWWLRSAYYFNDFFVGFVHDDGGIYESFVKNDEPGVSPALNLNLSSVIFSSANTVSKSLALTSSSTEIDTTTNAEWKLTLKDSGKSVALTEGRSVTKASDGIITVPYTYTDNENATDSEKVDQISVMITDKAYGSENAQILYYGALQNVKDTDGTDSTVAEATTGTGTFVLPSGLTSKMQGTDYHIYLLAEHVSEGNNTDYASEPLEIKVKTPINTVAVPSMDAPIAEFPLEIELEIAGKNVSSKASVTWKKGETEVTGNAELNATYQAFVTLTAVDGCTFMDAAGGIANVTLNGKVVDLKDVMLNDDGTLTVACGEYTTVARKITEVAAPTVPTQFASCYAAENVLASTELGTTAKVTLEGNAKPNSKDMKVEWTLANENGAPYDATSSASNTFKWTVIASEYATYDVNGKVMEGTVTIQNNAELPGEVYETEAATEKKITSANTDKADAADSTFAKLRLKAIGKNKSVKLTWKKVKEADGYILYGAQCGKKLKKMKTFTKASTVKYTQKKLKKGKYYKYMVVAYKNINGQRYILASSKTAHAVTTGGKYANPTKVTVKSSKITIKKGKKKNIKASYKVAKGKKCQTHIAKFRYESSDTKIATVNKKGKVTGRKKGTCYIYVYAQNGVYKKVKVIVK